MVIIFISIVFLCGVSLGEITDYKRVCYYGSWEIYINGFYRFTADDITDLDLCTHYIYSFAGVDHKTKTIVPIDDMDQRVGYKKLTDKKKINRDIKVMLAVGGWAFGVKEFSELVKTNASIDLFCENAVKYLRKWRFDGVDMDWEYPANRGSPPSDKKNFATLLEKLRKRFESEARETGRPRLLLSSAVPISKSTLDSGYDRNRIGKAVDFLNIMVYDLYTTFSDKVGHHSALYPRAGASGDDLQLNAEWGMKYWAEEVEKGKLILGLPSYSRTFTMNTTVNQPGNWNLSTGITFTTVTTLNYYEICKKLKENKWTEGWDSEQSVPFAFTDTEWSGYDNERSVQAKAEFVKDNQYGGMMVWQLASDDFPGTACRKGKFPIVRAIKTSLEGSRDDCRPGMYGHINRKACLPCPKNTYQFDHKATSCRDCPDGMITRFEGAMRRDKCISECDLQPNYCSYGDCRPTPTGMSCKCWKGYQGRFCEEVVAMKHQPMKPMIRMEIITLSFAVTACLLLFVMVVILACICRRLAGTQMKYVVNSNGVHNK